MKLPVPMDNAASIEQYITIYALMCYREQLARPFI